jgi:3-deoxy-D-arabino-heptulosonate 7-phosphate (DAHP) synthase
VKRRGSPKKHAILAGQGALRAGEQLVAVAEKLGAPIVKALLGKAAVPDDSPYTTHSLMCRRVVLRSTTLNLQFSTPPANPILFRFSELVREVPCSV